MDGGRHEVEGARAARDMLGICIGIIQDYWHLPYFYSANEVYSVRRVIVLA